MTYPKPLCSPEGHYQCTYRVTSLNEERGLWSQMFMCKQSIFTIYLITMFSLSLLLSMKFQRVLWSGTQRFVLFSCLGGLQNF